jgi:hypothetical protein
LANASGGGRAAFESPKLTAVTESSMSGNDFATLLERAILPSAEVKQIELRPNEEPSDEG